MDFGPKKVVFECVYSEKSNQKWFLSVFTVKVMVNQPQRGILIGTPFKVLC